MTKIRLMIFASIVSLFICGPSILYLCTSFGLNLPSNVTAEESFYLSGGYQETDIPSVLSIEGFQNQQLQAQLETTVGNNIPCKAKALMSNAAMQETVIKASNLLFGFPTYKTNFNSDRLYIPEADAVSTIPPKNQKWRDESAQFFAKGLRDVALRYPDKNFVMFCVDGLDVPAVSPAYDLVKDSVSADEMVAIFNTVLEDTSNVTLVRNEYDSLESYYADYFRTDHHWKIQGALRAYNSIAPILNLESFSADIVPLENYSFFGTNARSGLYPLEETAYDIDFDFSNLEEYDFDGTMTIMHFGILRKLAKSTVSFHDLYFDGHGPIILNIDGTGNMLFFADSFGGDVLPLFGEQYRKIDTISHLINPEAFQTQWQD